MAVDIVIVLVNFNGHKDTVECLASLKNIAGTSYKIVVVDNSSNKESIKFLMSWASEFYKDQCFEEILDINNVGQVKKNGISEHKLFFIKSENHGFAAANNVGINFALNHLKVDWFWLLNNDTIVSQNILQEFNIYQEQITGKCGMIGTNLFYYHKPDKLQGIGGYYNKWLGTSKHVTALPKNNAQFDGVVNYIIGASMFVSKLLIEEVGLMDESYFLYYEEIDWAVRSKRKGWSLGYCEQCNVYHKEGATIGSADNSKLKSDLADYYGIRNKLLFTRKNYKSLLIFIALSVIGSVMLRIIRLQLKRAIITFKILVKEIFTKEGAEIIHRF